MNRTSIIVPTIGRESLRATLLSILEDWEFEEVLVCCEKNHDEAEAIFDEVDPQVTYDGEPCWQFHRLADSHSNSFGHSVRNFALNYLVSGSHVCSIDDDDVYLDGALAAIAEAVVADNAVTVLRCKWGVGHFANGTVKWEQPGVRKGEVATPMVVARVGRSRWGGDYFGDFLYYQALQAEFPDAADWHWDERIIAEIRPVADDG